MVVPGLIGLTRWIIVLIGTVRLMLLTLLLRKWPGTGLTPTLVLSRLLALALGFELQVGGPENIWLISAVVLQPHTPVMTWRYITFGDGE
jgi:1-acyl-sn-glycerol-3-phosphate acyltransferase